VNEKTFGKEQIKLKIDRLQSVVPIDAFGDPVAGATAYAVCVYGEPGTLVATLRVNRAGQPCGTRSCWKTVGGPGYKYADKQLASDGVLQVLLKSGALTKGKVIANGKNNLPRGFTTLPIGVAPMLSGHRSATVQVVSSDAGCVTGTVTNIRDASNVLFKGTAP
jgi:hypothetical protein